MCILIHYTMPNMPTGDVVFLKMKYSIAVPNLGPKHEETSGTESYMLCMT